MNFQFDMAQILFEKFAMEIVRTTEGFILWIPTLGQLGNVI